VTGKKEGSVPPSLFSQRRFPPQDNLIQLRVRYNGHGLTHLTFLLQPFTLVLPRVIKQLAPIYKQEDVAKFNLDGFRFSPKHSPIKKKASSMPASV
jgi:hypothetical protein